MSSELKQVYGYIEHVRLVENQLLVSAKLDTGAKSASLNAKNIKQIMIQDKPYLRFVVPTKAGKGVVFTCEYAGEVNIKMRAAEAKLGIRHFVKRPVVKMLIQIGDKEKKIRVNLTNRKRFLYPLLLGREALIAFDGVVDPALTYTIKKEEVTSK